MHVGPMEESGLSVAKLAATCHCEYDCSVETS